MIDSHVHLYFDRFDDDRDAVVERARAAGVTEMIQIGIDVGTSRQALDLARRYEGFHATAGVHPTSPVDDPRLAVREIAALLDEAPAEFVAIGEIGLDYYWKDVAAEDQHDKLVLQLDLALQRRLPVIFHCRDALDDLLSLLEGREANPPGVFHCFGGGPEEAERALRLGFHVSFAGNVTFPKAQILRDAAAKVPPERLLLETDSPFLAPQPRRGKRNEPSFLPMTAAVLAEIHELSTEALIDRATRTTRELFRLPAP